MRGRCGCYSAWARGYALKRSPVKQLLRAVRAVAAGGTYVDPEMAVDIVGHFLGDGAERPDSELSDRELLVMRRIAMGYSNKEIAARLRLSGKTVEMYKARAMEKLRLRSRVVIL